MNLLSTMIAVAAKKEESIGFLFAPISRPTRASLQQTKQKKPDQISSKDFFEQMANSKKQKGKSSSSKFRRADTADRGKHDRCVAKASQSTACAANILEGFVVSKWQMAIWKKQLIKFKGAEERTLLTVGSKTTSVAKASQSTASCTLFSNFSLKKPH